jgi:hypothetical protein
MRTKMSSRSLNDDFFSRSRHREFLGAFFSKNLSGILSFLTKENLLLLFFEGRLGAAKAARGSGRASRREPRSFKGQKQKLMQVSIGMVGRLLVSLG